MTKGEIIAAIYDFDGSAEELREIATAANNRLKSTRSDLISEIRPRVQRGETVRVELQWSSGEVREAIVLKVNPKRLKVKVPSMPIGRQVWNCYHQSLLKVLS